MKKTRRRYSRDFKVSVVKELERQLHQAYAENELLKKAFSLRLRKD